MHTVTRSLLAAAGFALVLGASAALAQNPPTVRVRGTIEKVDGDTLIVRSRDGADLKIVPASNPLIIAIVKATVADIKQGSFVGVTGMPQPDGSQRAIEVHIFPESMRGTGEGHYPWDLRPQSTMTNANVEQTVAAMEGQTLTLKYKDGEKKIIVPADAVIVTYVPGDKAELKPGTKIIVAATKQEDGSLRTPRINYGKDGLTPPM
jgi:ribosome maturation factor RimP